LQKPLVNHFLNSNPGGQTPIASIYSRNPIRGKRNADGTLSIRDVLAVDQFGRQINTKTQFSLPFGMAERPVFYAVDADVSPSHEGQTGIALHPSISICVLPGSLFREPTKRHFDFWNWEKSFPPILKDDLTIDWVTRLLLDQELAEAAGVLEMITRTPDQLREHNSHLQAQRDEEARLNRTQQQDVEIGEARGKHERKPADSKKGQLCVQIMQQQLLNQPVSAAEQLAAFGTSIASSGTQNSGSDWPSAAPDVRGAGTPNHVQC